MTSKKTTRRTTAASVRAKPALVAEPARRARGTGAAEVYQRLREDILDLSLQPGTALDEARLSIRFGLSRSPVREALIRLSAEGLVMTLPNHSTLVAPFDVQMLPKYLDALELLQRANTRLAARLRTGEEVEQLHALCDDFEVTARASDVLGMIERNREFHLAIAEAGRNPYLIWPYRRLLDEGRRMMRLYFGYLHDELPGGFLDEHREIVEAIAERDAERAERIAHQHARQFSGRFLQYLNETHTSAVDVAASLD